LIEEEVTMSDQSRKAKCVSDRDITFEGVDAKFEWTNEAWGLAHLPNVRIASLLLQRDDYALEETWASMGNAGLVPDVLERLCTTREHLEALVDLLRTALARSTVVLERLGYLPDLPPPDHALH
jgi:hypothetical protein